MVYSERDLFVPFLIELNSKPKGLTTTQLRLKLKEKLELDELDMQLNPSRPDSKFSQKVRNLKSHNSIINKKLVTYKNGIWKITKLGKNYLNEIDENEKYLLIKSLEEQGFKEEKIKQTSKNFSNILIEEATSIITNVNIRKRSSRLRIEAIKQCKLNNKGNLPCVICGFDFKKKYGKIGEDFIEIHHLDLISESDIKGKKYVLIDALKKVVPVCSNCHSMIHKNRKLMNILELKKMVEENAKNK